MGKRYNSLKEQGVKVEMVFLSWDRDESSFKEYFGVMPWLAVPYGERALKEQLDKTLSVWGIPTLVICNGDGTQYNTGGRRAVMGDPSKWMTGGKCTVL